MTPLRFIVMNDPRLGKIPDARLALELGVTYAMVRRARARLGIGMA